MGFLKTLDLPNGTKGKYIKLGEWRIDAVSREAVAHFRIYASKKASEENGQHPLCTQVIKVRLRGADYEKYCGKAAKRAAGGDIEAQLYRAAKTEKLVSDWGEAPFAGAEDVIEDAPTT